MGAERYVRTAREEFHVEPRRFPTPLVDAACRCRPLRAAHDAYASDFPVCMLFLSINNESVVTADRGICAALIWPPESFGVDPSPRDAEAPNWGYSQSAFYTERIITMVPVSALCTVGPFLGSVVRCRFDACASGTTRGRSHRGSQSSVSGLYNKEPPRAVRIPSQGKVANNAHRWNPFELPRWHPSSACAGCAELLVFGRRGSRR